MIPYQLSSITPLSQIAIFDFDGTLVETTQANNAAYAHAAMLVCGYNLESSTIRITHENIPKLIQVDKSVIENIIKTKERFYTNYLYLTRTLPCTEILKVLYKSHYKTFLLTNGKRSRIEQLLLFHNIGKFFTDRFFHEDYMGENKYIWLSEHINTKPNTFFVFENETTEVSSALSIGIPKENIFLTNNL